MAILQALFALVSKSAGKVLNAIFGWAVRALFGQTSSREQTFLSAVVGAAVAWPLLLVGLVTPKVAALMLAFVPIPHWIPSWAVRLVWLGLAVIVPLAVGLAVAAKAPPRTPPESFITRVLRGFPITVGLAAAFVIMFVSVPLMRFAALIRRQQSADVPLITDADAYHEVAAKLRAVLSRHGFVLHPARPGWWVSAPTRLLTWFGGAAFRAYVPDRLEHFESPDMTMSMYPSGILLRGRKSRITLAHGLIAESVVHTRGLQTTDAKAQVLEKQLRRLWGVYDLYPSAHTNASALLARLGELTRDLGALDVGFDDWQVLYRQLLQVERAVRGEHQLMDDETTKPPGGREERAMANDHEGDLEKASLTGLDAGQLATADLFKRMASDVETLVKKQFELAKSELVDDLRREAGVAGGLGIAAVAALLTANLLLVSGALALSLVMPAWAAGLVVSGLTLATAALVGVVSWRRRVRDPLVRTRRALKENVRWTKERLA
jgi:hypothetical protein